MKSLKDVIGQHVLIGVSGHALTSEEKKFIVENNISGVTLFGRNVSEPKQIWELCSEIQSLSKLTSEKTPIFIGIDMEGGRVARLKEPFTKWPPLKKLGDIDSPTLSFEFAQAMGRELKAFGINLDYAPCIDILTNPKNPVIGDRALSSDPEIVAKHASALIRGYSKTGVIPCVKHFPGHGDTFIDSHFDLPKEKADLERLRTVELVPFKKSMRTHLDLLMTAHILFENVDPDWPVTFSEIFLKKLLREELRYKGLVITDDLGMKALAGKYEPGFIPVRALQAGADLLLYCNEPEAPPIAVEAIAKAISDGDLKKENLESSYQRIIEMKSRTLKSPGPLPMEEALRSIGTAEHLKISQQMTQT